MKTSQLSVLHVRFLPQVLTPGVLYVSEEYKVAGHSCACGCGSKVIVPLGPAEWTYRENQGQPSLSPSIGNWQLPCRSHYIINNGGIIWASQWSEAQIKAGRQGEETRRQHYYSTRTPDTRPFLQWVWDGVKSFFGI